MAVTGSGAANEGRSDVAGAGSGSANEPRPDAAARIAARFSMAGRRALITGGSVSIGRAIVEAFADAGAALAIQYSSAWDASLERADQADALRRTLDERNIRAVLIDADFSEPGAGTWTVQQAQGALGGVDVLVVCASVQQREPFGDISVEQRERQTRINFHATVELLEAAVPGMKAQGWGRILTIGSINQTRPEPTLAVYAALKSAQHNLAINLARQLAPHGVIVNNLSPGLVATERNRWRRADAAEWEQIQARANPMGRAGTPDEIAGAALLLCSEAGSFITGADLQATGGGHL
jgi:NAD(P)-dependent dehydrogenase (short-subunit alcohol dehydrogenase family)